MILLDTNVLSEVLRPAPSASVVNWLNRHFPECVISSITIFELVVGVSLLPAGKRREALDTAVSRMVRRFGTRVYAFDAAAAHAAARALERTRMHGASLHQIPAKLPDLQIAGIALAYGLELATRNVADFEAAGLTLVNPWDNSSA